MDMAESLLQRERDLVHKNQEVDAKTQDILQRVQAGRPSSRGSASDAPRVGQAAARVPSQQQGGHDAVTSAELTALREQLKAAVEKAQRLEAERDKSVSEAARHVKMVQSLKAKIEKDEGRHDEAVSRAKDAAENAQAVKRETTALKKGLRAAESAVQGKEAQLQRALEEADRWKQQAQQRGSDPKEVDALRDEMLRLQSDNKKLQTQKQELLVGFKKQARLIDVLKRQKAHLEAAKLLSFTEEEFVKALDMGEGICS